MLRKLTIVMISIMAIVLTGCGGSIGSTTTPTMGRLSSLPEEAKKVGVYWQEDEKVYRSTETDEVVQNEKAATMLGQAEGAADRAHINWTKIRIPAWNRKHGWYWLYFAYDDGHGFNWPQLNGRPHVNFCKYSSWSEMLADESQRTSRRAFYDGHFTIYKSGTGWCAFYFVSKDADGGPVGVRMDNCINTSTAKQTVALSSLSISVAGLWAELRPLIQITIQDLQAAAGAI